MSVSALYTEEVVFSVFVFFSRFRLSLANRYPSGKDKNHKNPLKRMGAKPLVPVFRFGLIRASS